MNVHGMRIKMSYYSWRVTVFTQTIFMFAAFFILSTLMSKQYNHTSDFYFITVGNGQRTLAESTSLIQQMEIRAKKYGVEFVVSVGDHNHNDSLFTTVRQRPDSFPSLQVPWYFSAGTYEDHSRFFTKEAMIPLQHVLKIIFIDTTELKASLISNANNGSFEWLHNVLSESIFDWCIVIGEHPLKVCDASRKVTKTELDLHNMLSFIFTKYGVNLYIHSQQNFSQETLDKGIIHIGNSLPLFSSHQRSPIKDISNFTETDITPYIENQTCSWVSEDDAGFILYRVNPFEMEIYFMDSRGSILHRSTLHPTGIAAQ